MINKERSEDEWNIPDDASCGGGESRHTFRLN